MIAGVSKIATVFLSPILCLVSLILFLLTFLAPVVTLKSGVALLIVSPNGNGTDVDGPTLRLGPLGSCSRPNNNAPFNCTTASITPVYDLSALGSSSNNLLASPTAGTPVFIAMFLVLFCVFFILFTATLLRDRLGARISAMLDKSQFRRSVAWIGFTAFLIGMTSFLVLRLWFGKAVDTFNIDAGLQKTPLAASIGNGFIMVWVAFAFFAVPLMCALVSLHVLQSNGKV